MSIPMSVPPSSVKVISPVPRLGDGPEIDALTHREPRVGVDVYCFGSSGNRPFKPPRYDFHHGIGRFRVPGLTDDPPSRHRRRIPRWCRSGDVQLSKRSEQGRSSTAGARRHGIHRVVRPDHRIPARLGRVGHHQGREITVFLGLQRLLAAPTTDHPPSVPRQDAHACALA